MFSGFSHLYAGVTKLHVTGAKSENLHRKYTSFYLVKFN